jgi:molybdate transport system ATP-binding protein
MTAGSGDIEFAYQLQRDNFSLDVAATLELRGICGVFGRSGSGKTSLLRCLAGLDSAATGHLRVGGATWEDSDRGICLPPDAREIGYVFQEPRLFPQLDVRRNLEYGRRRRRREPAIDFAAVVELLGLAALLDRRPAALSGGEAQRVAIGRAVLRAPRFLLMDEPLAALDAEHKNEILPFIRQLHAESGVPVFYVTHGIDELCQLCDQLLLIDGGRVCAAGDLQALLLQTDLPQLGGAQAGVLLDARVLSVDADDALCTLSIAAGKLFAPGTVPADTAVRVRIRASDVSVCRAQPAATSILNRLPVTVSAVQDETTGSVLLHLEAAGDVILARITRRSARELGIRTGEHLVAQIKAVSLRPGRAGEGAAS